MYPRRSVIILKIMVESFESEVVVVGAGVSGLTCAHDLVRGKTDVILVERQNQVGGCAQTLFRDGFLFETGPFNLLVRDPLFEDLLTQLEDRIEVVPPSPSASRRDLILDGRMVKLPGSLVEAALTPILSPSQKARILLEPVVGRRPTDPDPTLGDLFRRRLGDAFTDRILSAAVIGIFGADCDRLSAKSCFRFFWEIDRKSRSFLIGGVLRRLRSRMNTRRWKGMVSFRDGIGSFCEALAQPLGDNLHLGTTVTEVKGENGDYTLSAKGPSGEERRYRAAHLVLGVDHPTACKLLAAIAPDVSSQLSPIESVSLAVVNAGFKESAFSRLPEGFGFLVPKTETDVHILGVLWASSVFPHHAPEGCVGIRIFSGGVRSPEWVDLPEEELVKRSLAELARFIEVREPPVRIHVSRYKNAVPQMVPGHSDRIERVEKHLSAYPGLHLVGNYLHGVSVNDCVCHARRTAASLGGTLAR